MKENRGFGRERTESFEEGGLRVWKRDEREFGRGRGEEGGQRI